MLKSNIAPTKKGAGKDAETGATPKSIQKQVAIQAKPVRRYLSLCDSISSRTVTAAGTVRDTITPVNLEKIADHLYAQLHAPKKHLVQHPVRDLLLAQSQWEHIREVHREVMANAKINPLHKPFRQRTAKGQTNSKKAIPGSPEKELKQRLMVTQALRQRRKEEAQEHEQETEKAKRVLESRDDDFSKPAGNKNSISTKKPENDPSTQPRTAKSGKSVHIAETHLTPGTAFTFGAMQHAGDGSSRYHSKFELPRLETGQHSSRNSSRRKKLTTADKEMRKFYEQKAKLCLRKHEALDGDQLWDRMDSGYLEDDVHKEVRRGSGGIVPKPLIYDIEQDPILEISKESPKCFANVLFPEIKQSQPNTPPRPTRRKSVTIILASESTAEILPPLPEPTRSEIYLLAKANTGLKSIFEGEEGTSFYLSPQQQFARLPIENARIPWNQRDKYRPQFLGSL